MEDQVKKEDFEKTVPVMDVECSGQGECRPEPVDIEDLDVTPNMSNHMYLAAKKMAVKVRAVAMKCQFWKK